MKLNFITFMVGDIERSIEFYGALAGLKVMRRFNPGMGEIAFMGNAAGETLLEFICFEKAEKFEAKGMVVCFACEGSLNDIRSKAIELGYEPTEIFTGGPEPENFKVADPDGILVEFAR